jgi:hypothetical protein
VCTELLCLREFAVESAQLSLVSRLSLVAQLSLVCLQSYCLYRALVPQRTEPSRAHTKAVSRLFKTHQFSAVSTGKGDYFKYEHAY